MRVIDSHTGGEPTRVVVDAAGLVQASAALGYRRELEREADWVRTALTHEPRGAPWMVGALLTPPPTSEHVCGVVFFNNDGYLGMCGHGLIGVVATLRRLGRAERGRMLIDTPVGDVGVDLLPDGRVRFENVLSYVHATGVEVATASCGVFRGDIAYGGNWFFLTECEDTAQLTVKDLTRRAEEISDALERDRITAGGERIDHIELCGPPSNLGKADGRNFVLCPGREVDRSPCGTGTSAKVACLAASGRLSPGEVWRQESITGSIFTATYRVAEGGVVPSVTGVAHVTADLTLVVEPEDPLRHGFQLGSLLAPVPLGGGA